MPISIHIFSDGTGEEAYRYYKTILSSFKSLDFNFVIHPFTNDKDEIDRAIQKISQEDWVIASLNDSDLANFLIERARENQIRYFDPLTPFLQLIERKLHQVPEDYGASLPALDADYFERIQAIEFAVSSDDGKNVYSYDEADIVLLGVSRTSKTPLSVYLANFNYKVANLPLLPEVEIPDQVLTMDPRKIVGLTHEPEILQKVRRERNLATGLEADNRYSSLERIKQELAYADTVFDRLGCWVINVSNKSVEETAAHIIKHMQDLAD